MLSMVEESLTQRYAGTPVYSGPLVDEPALTWLRNSRLRTLTLDCRLPECRRKVVVTAHGRHNWYCTPTHAALAARRRRKIERLIANHKTQLAEHVVGPSGRPTSRRGRELANDLSILEQLLISYPNPNDL